MKIAIRDFMGCRSADVEVAHMALLGGKNAQGKSSTCRAIAYALAGQPVPAGMTKGAAGALIYSGAAKGSVEVRTADGVVSLAYPKALLASDGMQPRASVWAAGIRTVAELPDKERVEIIRDIIGAVPTKADLAQAILEQGVNPDHTDKIWEIISKEGWEAAHKKAQDKGREIKAQWEYASGEKYGEKKAEVWLPRNWSAGIELASKDSLEAIVTGARADLELQIAQAAVDGAEIAALKEKAEKLEDLNLQLAEAITAQRAAEKTVEEARAARDALPPATQRTPTACPHCAGSVFVESGKLVKADGLLSADELKKRADALDAANKTIASAQDILTNHRTHIGSLHAQVQESAKAVARLDTMPAGGNATEADIDRAREALRIADQDIKTLISKSETDRLHKSVLANQMIVDLLSPDGVRRKVLIRALQAFNVKLAEVSNLMGWGAVTITPELDVEYVGRGYFFLSESEKFRARVTLQMLVAETENATGVVIDGADILDAGGRAGLFNGLKAMGIPAVIGMTWLQKPETMPDLAKIGCGQNYWVEAGVVTPIGKVA